MVLNALCAKISLTALISPVALGRKDGGGGYGKNMLEAGHK
jgi:hypothetical protein